MMADLVKPRARVGSGSKPGRVPKSGFLFSEVFQRIFRAQSPHMMQKSLICRKNQPKNNLPQYQLPVASPFFFLSSDSTLLKEDSRFRGGKRDMDICLPKDHNGSGSDHPFGACQNDYVYIDNIAVERVGPSDTQYLL